MKTGQFLLQVDRGISGARCSAPKPRSRRRAPRWISSTRRSARAAIKQAQDNFTRQQQLWKGGLTTKEMLDRAENELKMRQAELRSQEQQVLTQKLRIQQEQATLETDRYNLSKVRIESPINGIVTRRNGIEEMVASAR